MPGNKRGFTLVELIIVIIILGILAALAVPQFMASTTDAQIATLQGDLAAMRHAIMLYHAQHSSTQPGARSTIGNGSVTGIGENPAAFVEQLTQYTNPAGKVSADIDRANYPFGPYLANGIPKSPFSGVNTVLVVDSVSPLAVGDVSGNAAWLYCKNTGEIRANDVNYLAH